MATPIRLTYIGAGPEMGAWVPGWPASDHDEPDTNLALEKVRSGLYKPLGAADDSELSQRAQARLDRAADAGAERQAAIAGEADYQQPEAPADDGSA